ncbi:hypothetical protein DPMN_180247 [Dreissena polymorpha]|uniref:Uncharacterized protein n=1 Tax=Dreissena polymorpha TaxID=45954 RepID=A0A9D4IKB1_DREPO|nr:hypothetical protein DPMN_180247 [Dreissena polymorpha]
MGSLSSRSSNSSKNDSKIGGDWNFLKYRIYFDPDVDGVRFDNIKDEDLMSKFTSLLGTNEKINEVETYKRLWYGQLMRYFIISMSYFKPTIGNGQLKSILMVLRFSAANP